MIKIALILLAITLAYMIIGVFIMADEHDEDYF